MTAPHPSAAAINLHLLMVCATDDFRTGEDVLILAERLTSPVVTEALRYGAAWVDAWSRGDDPPFTEGAFDEAFAVADAALRARFMLDLLWPEMADDAWGRVGDAITRADVALGSLASAFRLVAPATWSVFADDPTMEPGASWWADVREGMRRDEDAARSADGAF